MIVASLIGSIVITGCKKKETEPAVKQNDQTGSAAMDGSMDDVNDYISNNIGGGSNKAARVAAYNLPCGIIRVDSTGTGSKKAYSLHYGNQTPCGYKRKSGDITFQLIKGNRFDSTGAVFAINYINYKVEALANGDVVTLNGTLYVTNLNGGFIWQTVVQSKTIEHTIRGTLTITYGNNQMRERKYYQHRTWASSNGWAGLTFSVSGDTTIASIKISETGKTYEGNYDYQTQILTTFFWSNCGTTYAGPYVLKTGLAKMNVSVPNISPAYFQIEAGYYEDPNNSGATPLAASDCSSNAYKITTQIGTTTTTQFQLY